MLPPLDKFLEEFGISHRNGFLPEQLPLRSLADSYYEPWEVLVDNIPSLIRTQRLRQEIDTLPVLSTSSLLSEREWQRAYVLLSFLTHGYIWGGEAPSEVLPPAVSCPFLEVASRLGLPPTATYAALNLWNFTTISPHDGLCQPDNLLSLHTFTGTTDESWFYSISIAMEARGGTIIPVMLKAMDAVKSDDCELVSECLIALAACLQELGVLLERMYERCDPMIFYHEIRPMLAGSKNMAVAGLPKGVFYDDGEGTGEWRQYSGGSNAQSSLIQFVDVVLGVEHRATGGAMIGKKNAFMQEMRNYMPRPHARFLNHLCSTTIRNYVLCHDSTHSINEDYNSAVAKLAAFRDVHIQIVTRYIVFPSKAPVPVTRRGSKLNLAVGSTLNASKTLGSPGLQGTGGTQLMPFLKQTRNETRDAATYPS